MLPRGARSATCSTARFSVTLIFSPRNMASIRAAQAAFVRQLKQELERFVGDAVLRVIEEEADRFGCQALAAFGVGGKELPQMQALDFL